MYMKHKILKYVSDGYIITLVINNFDNQSNLFELHILFSCVLSVSRYIRVAILKKSHGIFLI